MRKSTKSYVKVRLLNQHPSRS
ncbi:hypothetical protein F383_21475 [Gossypium arboreum]|uniref:Uncharacterized protein n=1 Tax=Gossypium arboreum TaxID=29729 RepID=A0A0B0ML67_GOSAR|nr:hypothetical protein F383_21475 [Gossypium arboreum]